MKDQAVVEAAAAHLARGRVAPRLGAGGEPDEVGHRQRRRLGQQLAGEGAVGGGDGRDHGAAHVAQITVPRRAHLVDHRQLHAAAGGGCGEDDAVLDRRRRRRRPGRTATAGHHHQGDQPAPHHRHRNSRPRRSGEGCAMTSSRTSRSPAASAAAAAAASIVERAGQREVRLAREIDGEPDVAHDDVGDLARGVGGGDRRAHGAGLDDRDGLGVGIVGPVRRRAPGRRASATPDRRPSRARR